MKETRIEWKPPIDLTPPGLVPAGSLPAPFVFYDIETTGLSREHSLVYLVGAMAYNQDKGLWELHQWLAEKPDQEKEVLTGFTAYLQGFGGSIQFNGDRFDAPFLKARCGIYRLPDPLQDQPSLDLYRQIRPLKRFLGLQGLKQEQLEHFLGLADRESVSGKQCIRLYREYVGRPSESLQAILLKHNEEDLKGLLSLCRLLSFRQLTEGNFQVQGLSYHEKVVFSLKVDFPFPREVRYQEEDFSLLAQGREAQVELAAKEGRIRRFYEDYKDYDYLPQEDTAIPKVISAFMGKDKTLREKASPQTCYTWIPCSQELLSRQDQWKDILLPLLRWHLRPAPCNSLTKGLD